MRLLFLYAYTHFQCIMELSKKRKRSTNWTHTKKGVLRCTVSQSAIEKPCQPEDNPVYTNNLPTTYHKAVLQNFCISIEMLYPINAPANPAKP